MLRRIALTLALLLLLARPALAFEEAWAQGEGYADVKGNVTHEQAQAKAMNMARAQALQKVSGLKVSDQFLQVTSERDRGGADFAFKEFSAISEGLILETANIQWLDERISTGRLEPPFQRIKVKANFKVAKAPSEDPSLNVRLKLNRATVGAGDALKLTLTAAEPVHAMIVNLAADERVYVLFPNPYRPELKLERNKPLELPSRDDGFDLRPQPLAGHDSDTEVIRAIVARSPLPSPPMERDGAMSLQAFYRWMMALPRSQWALTDQTYTVYAAPKSK